VREKVWARLTLSWLLACAVPLSASALNVPGTSAQLAWTAATGPVAGYAVEVSRNGGAFLEESRVAATATSVSGAIGDTLTVRVRAYDAIGRVGPASTPSDAITFTSTAPPPPPPAPSGPTGDIDGNGLTDALAFDSATGTLSAVLLMGDGSRRWVSLGAPRDPAMRPAGYSDVDGDGSADLLLRSATSGANELWLMRGTTYAVLPLPAQAARFGVAALRDFSGDGLADVFFHDATKGESVLWTLTGDGVSGALPVDPAPTGSKLAAIADVDGDGAPDLLWQRTSRRTLQAWLLSGTVPRAVVGLGTGLSGARIVGVGDLDASGSDDLVWSRPTTTGFDVYVWFLAGTSAPRIGLAARFGSKTSFRGVVDADADGRDDFVVEGTSRVAFEVSPVRPSGSTTRWLTTQLKIPSGLSGSWQFVSLD
jgi:hypothetical protein